MCGIAGVFDRRHLLTPERHIVEQMANALGHRGPDDEAIHAAPGVGLAVRRLAIVDRRHGRQPMFSENGAIVSVCNGEIFNQQELRTTLAARGHRFTTSCDVEILPHAYEEWGERLTEHLDGQFAFAIIDHQQRRMMLARDHLGVCPLFYTEVGDLIVFGSEIKAILRWPGIRKALDFTGLDQVLCFPGLVSPRTMFAGIHSLPAGHRLIADARGVVSSEYWDLDYPLAGEPLDGGSEAEHVEQLGALLSNSVAARLASERKVGVYLSGGLDSSLVAALASRMSPPRSLETFSVSFPNESMSEAAYQHEVADRIGSHHHDIAIDECGVLTRLAHTVYHAECPLRETYDTACDALGEAARRTGTAVILTGEGSDELFGGYIGYRYDLHRAKSSKAPDPLEVAIRQQLWGDAGVVYDRGYAELATLKRRLYAPDVAATLEQFDAFRHTPINAARLRGRHAVHQRSYLDIKLRLADHLLGDHGDRMCMAHGIEPRHPFLSRDLVEFARTLPLDRKINGWCEKFVVKRAAVGLVPATVIDREKFGWYAYGTPRLLRSHPDQLEEMLSPQRVKARGVFNPAEIERLKKRYSAPAFELQQPFEVDLLAIAVTLELFLEAFSL